jgi:hypothetical protein
MEYIINNENEDNKIILFVYNERSWEILLDIESTEGEIQSLINKRIADLDSEYIQYGNYDFSNLFEDYKNNINYGN